jgi:hypothetical protein
MPLHSIPSRKFTLEICYQPTSAARPSGRGRNDRLWLDSEMAQRPDGVRFLGYSGLVVLTATLSESDPEQTIVACCRRLRDRAADINAGHHAELRVDHLVWRLVGHD